MLRLQIIRQSAHEVGKVVSSTHRALLPQEIHIKTIPLNALTGPEGTMRLRLPDFKRSVHKVARFSTLRTGRLYP
jgi:hypothetical protein